jgi:hypothetical protein
MGGRAAPDTPPPSGRARGTPPRAAPKNLRERFTALRNLPPFLRELWTASPPLLIADIVLRSVRAVLRARRAFRVRGIRALQGIVSRQGRGPDLAPVFDRAHG